MAATYRLAFDASGNPYRTKDDFTKTIAPGVGDDFATDGYTAGSLWLDTVTNILYICESAATGAAVWNIVGTGAGDIASLLVDLTVTGAHTVDRADAATHDLTLTGNATLTPDHSSPVAGEAIDLRILIRQDGTGGHTLAWGGTITWAGGSAPTMPTAANAMLTVGLLSVDDGTTWLGYAVEDGAGTPATTVESETTWGITPAVGTDTEYARQDHTHGTPAEPAGGGIGEILISDTPSTPLVFADLIQNEAQDDLVYADP